MTKQIISFLSILILLSSIASASPAMKFGFLDYPTELSSEESNSGVLTHVAYMSWGEHSTGTLNSDGSLDFPGDIDHYNAVKALVHKSGSKLIICITCSDDDIIDEVLANHPEDLANNVVSVIQTYGADGVNFDFEWIRPTNSIAKTSNTVLFENLMKSVYAKVKSANSTYHISIDSGNEVMKVLQNRNLNQYVDNAIICGYDYSTQLDSIKTGPNAPYKDSIRWDITDSVNLMLKYYDSQKVVLGIPFYGYEYIATSKNPGSTTTHHSYINMKSAIANSNEYDKLWDSSSHTPWYRYQSGNVWYQVWYDDSESIKLKYDYAKSKNLGGIGFWALGMEDPSIWKVF